MKRKYLIVLILIIFIIFLLFNLEIFNKEENDNNIVVSEENFEEEITSEIYLYFIDESGNIIAEGKRIPVNELVNNPYKYVLNLLKNEQTQENKKNILNYGFEIINCIVEGEKLKIVVSNNFSEIYQNNLDTVKEIMKKVSIQFKEISDIIIENENGEIL